MVTTLRDRSVGSLLFGRTRKAVLSLLYGHADESFYLRQIARATGVGLGPVQRELRLLTDAGIVRRRASGRQVYYQANADSPVFGDLKSLVAKTAGVGDTLRTALSPFVDRIALALVYGSVARGEETARSDIDVLAIGDVGFSELVAALQDAQSALGREINPVVYPIVEFEEKLSQGDHFIASVLAGPKVFLIGDKNELARLAGERLAGGTQAKPAGDQGSARHRRPRPAAKPDCRPRR